MFIVEFYERADGSYPVEEFILSLDVKMQAKVYRVLSLLEEYGNRLGSPYSKHLEDGIFELRIKQSSSTTRVLYFFCQNKHIILTNGFVKKRMKIPEEEIAIAKRRRIDYLMRKEGEISR